MPALDARMKVELPANADAASQRHEHSYAWPVDVLDAVRRRRMHRSFSAEAVTDDELARLAWAGGHAPLAGNSATRRFVIVSDPRIVATLREVMPSFISNARACIAICTDLALSEELMGERGRDVVSRIDAGTAAENVALAAVELGLGVCFSQSSTEAAVREVLELPDHEGGLGRPVI